MQDLGSGTRTRTPPSLETEYRFDWLSWTLVNCWRNTLRPELFRKKDLVRNFDPVADINALEASWRWLGASKTRPSLARLRKWLGSPMSALQSRATSQQLLIEEEHVMASLEPMSFLIKMSWQAQYLVKFKGHFFFAGAVFGEIWKDRRSAKCCIFQHTGVPWETFQKHDFRWCLHAAVPAFFGRIFGSMMWCLLLSWKIYVEFLWTI